jgi:hypothetical protein
MSCKASAVRAALLLILLASTCVPLRAQEPGAPTNGAPEIWLVTYGPGDIYWQRFGHNAIWVRDPTLGLDHTFNFGFFDFNQDDFFLRFLQGRMLYFSAARPASEEFAGYIDENRSIRAQRLALSADRAMDLAAHLLDEVRPANRTTSTTITPTTARPAFAMRWTWRWAARCSGSSAAPSRRSPGGTIRDA